MQWEKLCTATNEMEANLIAGLLKGAGIPVEFKYSSINNYLKVIMGPVVAVEIQVAAEKIKEAREILTAFRQTDP